MMKVLPDVEKTESICAAMPLLHTGIKVLGCGGKVPKSEKAFLFRPIFENMYESSSVHHFFFK